MVKRSKSLSKVQQDLFCDDLPSKPLPRIGKILVAGASGYIGGRLVPELLARGYEVRVAVRGNADGYRLTWPDAEVVEADALNVEQLREALEGIDTAYYLIHSLQLGPTDFEAADMKAAANFRYAASHCRIRRIIYLGGLGDIRLPLSSHLRNRMEVATELVMGGVPVTILRAAIIIGSGSASYEMIQHLVRKLPIIPVP
ncbi:MAG: NAD(P)H-binding protein, partial [candidate division Zixibacteria bacterium]